MTFSMQPGGAHAVGFGTDKSQYYVNKSLISGLSIMWLISVIILNWRADVNSEGGEDNAWLGM